MITRRRLSLVCLVTVLAVVAHADASVVTIDNDGRAAAPAVPLFVPVDAVSVFQTGELTAAVRDRALAASQGARATAVIGTGFSAGLVRLTRGATVLQQSRGAGWGFPMSITALPLEALGATMGRSVTAVVSQNQIVMGQSSATLRGAQAGDVVELRTATGGSVAYVIGLVAPDAQVGGTEIVMSSLQANQVFGGVALPTRVLIYNPPDRALLEQQLAAWGLLSDSKVRVRRSWDAFDPDSTLSLVRTKTLLGEFDIDYANLSLSGWTAMSPAWVAANLPPSRRSYPTGILARCHNRIHADLTAALQAVVNAGLSGGIDAANANAYGGCATGSARFSRITGNLGSVSRHSWGQPLDVNTVTNCQGCVPKMDCRIVRIFRAHNFAWGGNFLTPDGMHFEWVGERRDGITYPSRYCPNPVTTTTSSTRVGPPAPAGLGDLFVDDGWSGGHE